MFLKAVSSISFLSKTTKALSLSMFLSLGAVSISPMADAAINSMGEAINIAGRQRMLTQRMVKGYCMLGQKVLSAQAESELRQAITLFENQLKDLEGFRVNNEVSNGLAEVRRLWKPFKTLATRPPSLDQVQELRALGEKALYASHEVVLSLQDASGTNAGRLVNISGRQRMLSQRMANLYLLKSWGVNKSRYDSDLSQAMSEFKGALAELMAAEVNTPDIDRSLKKVKAQFAMFEYSLNTDSGEFIPQTIAKASVKILKMMNDITGWYATAS